MLRTEDEYPVDLRCPHDFTFIERLRRLTIEEIQDLIKDSLLHAKSLEAFHTVECYGGDMGGHGCPEIYDLAMSCPLISDEERNELIAWKTADLAKHPPRKPKQNKRGFVYLMKDTRSGHHKIGFSINPEYRERTLQSEKPSIVLVESAHGTFQNEGELHELFSEKRIRGEWFDLSSEEVLHVLAVFHELQSTNTDLSHP